MKTIQLNKAVKTRRLNRVKRSWSYLGAYSAGIIIGGIIPAVACDVAHYQTQDCGALWLVVAGFLGYSIPMASEWLTRYTGNWKAWCFVAGLECAMVFTHGWTVIAALLVLIGINAYVLAGRFTQD